MNGSMILPDILVTDLARPDMILINRKASPVEVIVMEMTLSWDSNCEKACTRKREGYEFLTQDITDRGYKCVNIPLGI